jgi:xylan 1,4-beta-xylosidase
VQLPLTGLPSTISEAKLTQYRVDANHSNSYEEWRRMGSPIAPNERQYRQLQEASNLAKLAETPASIQVQAGTANLPFSLPRQGVSLIIAEW